MMRTLTYLIILLALLAGCMPTFREQPKSPSPIQDPARLAKQLEGLGKYLEAAREYLRLAGSKPPPTRQGYQLSAIQAYLKAGQFEKAKAQLKQLDVSQSFGLEIPLELVQIKIDLVENKLEEALKRLRSIEPTTLPHPLQIQYRQLQTQALALQGQVAESLQGWLQLTKELQQEPHTAKENEQQLWIMLSSLNEKTLQQELKKSQDNIITGWLELALLNKTIPPKQLAVALNSWQLRYPKHPANQGIVKQLRPTVTPPSSTKQVALLLPKSNSRFSKQADAVREGFFAAAYANPERPHITLQQVDADNVVKVYEELASSGIDWVVGPLEKETLTLLAKNRPILPIPVLGLNYTEEATTPGNFYQFGLLPADEARAVARQAWQDGHRQALGLVPERDWGERILKAFQSEWEQQGGKLLVSFNYGDNFEKTLKKSLKNSPPVDLVFMVVFPEFAAKMRRLITTIFGENFPIYSTSHVYSGTPDSPKDLVELEGIKFVDMPWVLKPDEQGQLLQTSLQQSSPEGMKKFKRFYAFGIDAYYLSARLSPLNREWSGQSGHLYLENNGEIHRDQFLWAHFVKGVPQLLDSKP